MASNPSQTQVHTSVSDILGSATGGESPTGRQLVANPSTSVVPLLGEDAVHFQVGIAGESQLMVKLPKMAWVHKKRSGLSVVLKRTNQTIPVVVQELFDGVFSVQLHPRDTYGDVQVNLTMTKPPLSETLTVSFGDRYSLDYQPLKIALGVVNENLQKTIATISNYWADTQSSTSLQAFVGEVQRATQEVKEGVQGLWSRRLRWEWTRSWTSPSFPMRASKGARVFQTDVIWLAGEAATQGMGVLAQASNGISKARSAVLTLFDSVDTSGLRPKVDTTVIVDKLSTAQGRAQRIVSNAAGKLKLRNGSR